MIFYFTGTGNTYSVAKEVAAATNEKLINIANAWREKRFSYTLEEGERIGIVYPIHAWAPPTLVKRFIKKLQLNHSKDVYVYSILTCGDEWEGAVEHVKSALKKIGLSLQGDYAVIMPNNYVIGHELDTPETEHQKLSSLKEKIHPIIQDVTAKKVNYQRVKFSVWRSYFVYMLFQMGKLFPLFRANEQCVGCGMCEKACPMKVVHMKQGKDHQVPAWRWGSGCVQCSACINVCPRKAINYLGITKNRRRYFHPEYRKELH